MTQDMLGRRDVLRAGIWGTAMLAGGSMIASLAGCSSAPEPARGYRVLREGDITLLRPLVPVILGPAMRNETDADHVLDLLDRTLVSTTSPIRQGFFQLYDLLQLGAARWWLTGHWSHPAELDPAALQAGLASWESKDNWFARVAFRGLTQPLAMVWYAEPESGLSIGYPGPPKKVLS